MNYLYEHTWLSIYGRSLILLAFLFALLSAVSYSLAIYKKSAPVASQSWMKKGRLFFLIMSVLVFSAIGLLYYIMANHYFEFHYVWKHVSRSMNFLYLLAGFWSGQEGSLLLWSFWIILFSLLVMHKYGEWQVPVVGAASFALLFILSMLLGLSFGNLQVGISPFVLVRELPENAGMAWTMLPDYLHKIEGFRDGAGLNPLLRNYWMIIHPPFLFAGYGAAVFPFAFALAGLISGDQNRWLKPARTWVLISLFLLGAGILMGGAWAYVALSFGGFWAWDPVENASLAPWVALVAAVHSLLISIKRKKKYFLSYLLCLLPFLLVLYSSFLTRSGILGDSSVHAFTGNGFSPYLLAFLAFFSLLAIGALLKKRRLIWVFFISLFSVTLPVAIGGYSGISVFIALAFATGILIYAYEKYYRDETSDDDWSSREAWMTIGIMTLLLSTVHILATTSTPVLNVLFDISLNTFSGQENRNAFYAVWQTPFAISVIVLIVIATLLKYEKTKNLWSAMRALMRPALFSIAATAVILALTGIKALPYVLLLGVCLLAIAAFMANLKKGSPVTGAAVTHAGFALLIAGALVSSAGKRPISGDSLSRLSDDGLLNNENILLRKGDTLAMGNYFVSYRGKKRNGEDLLYEIRYWDQEPGEQGAVIPGDSLFTLYPRIKQDEKFGAVAEPGTKHYLTHDVFTHVKWADTRYGNETEDDFMDENVYKISLGGEARHENLRVEFRDIYWLEEGKTALGLDENDIAIQAELAVSSVDQPDEYEMAYPVFAVRDSIHVQPIPFYSEKYRAKFGIARLSHEREVIEISISEREYLVMQAVLFPGINLLWAGCILLIIGLLVSLIRLK